MRNKRDIEDITDDIRQNEKVFTKMEALLSKEKRATRKRIIERGIVHFRADEEFMTALLDVADQLKVAPGTLCRRLVWEQLNSLKTTPAADEESIRSIADELRTGQIEIRKELRKIRNFLGDSQSSR